MLKSMPKSTNSATVIPHTTAPVLEMALLSGVRAVTMEANTATNAQITITTLLRSNVDFILAPVTAPRKSFFLTFISLLLYPS